MQSGGELGSIRAAWSDFSGLGPETVPVRRLSEASQARHLRSGETLVAESEDDADIYLVGSGALRTVRFIEDGQEIWLADVRPGELVGEMAALTGRKRSSTVIAASEAEVYRIERSAFLSIAESDGRVALAVARLLASRLLQTSGHVTDLFGRTVAYRLHRELVRLGTPSNIDGELVRLNARPPMTQLKQRVHASREATSRALGELEERGLVVREDGVLIVMSLPDD